MHSRGFLHRGRKANQVYVIKVGELASRYSAGEVGTSDYSGLLGINQD
ncbi:hypothetical protein Hanom_Chr08g00747491 [Helianthus anomalus]